QAGNEGGVIAADLGGVVFECGQGTSERGAVLCPPAPLLGVAHDVFQGCAPVRVGCAVEGEQGEQVCEVAAGPVAVLQVVHLGLGQVQLLRDPVEGELRRLTQ